jgi:hypothetical protein
MRSCKPRPPRIRRPAVGGEQAQPEPFGFPGAGWAVEGEHLHPGEQFGGHGDELVPDLAAGAVRWP